MASKEVMVTAPLLVLLYDRTFVAGSWREAWRQRWPIHTALASTWLLLGFLVIASKLGERGVGFDGGVSSLSYVLTECRAVVLYVSRALWPHPLVFDYGWALSSGAAAAPYVLVSLVLISLTVLGVGEPGSGLFLPSRKAHASAIRP